MIEWFGESFLVIESRREFATIEQARNFARRLVNRTKLYLRPEWLNGKEYSGLGTLLGDAGDHRGNKNPMHGKRHRESSRAAMAAAKRGRTWVHRDREARQVSRDALERALSDGWSRGRPKRS